MSSKETNRYLAILPFLGLLISASTPPDQTACFKRIRATVPGEPQATRWKNTGGCSCADAVARAKGTYYVFR